MTLAKWLQSRPDLTLAAFGRLVGVSHGTVSRWARLLMRPDWPQIVAIYYATDGEVAPNDWLAAEVRELRPSHDPRQVSFLPPSRKAA